MSLNTRTLVVSNIKLPVDASFQEAFSVAEKRLKKAKAFARGCEYKVYKKSVDARNKNDICFVYSVSASGEFPKLDGALLSENGITELSDCVELKIEYGDLPSENPPLVVGSGPAGLFAALLLAENGYRPTVIERGSKISERQRIVESFNVNKTLNTETNIQFGAGGAGTFSDGKLVTRINDPLSAYVMKKFVEFGAPEEILYLAKPHIGTDVLAPLIDRMLGRIEELGGRVLYNTRYERSERVRGVNVAKTTREDIPYSALILAIGHSARDTYQSLIKEGYSIEAKPFSVGMRIEHLRENIDYAMYGSFAGHPALGHAEYNLSHNTKERGVYTFCMCPGGEVVAAASEENSVVVNGMSRHKRDGVNSNSAVVCSVFKEDYGATPLSAIEFQRKIERAAFVSGGSNYSAPIITIGDFLSDKCITEPQTVIPTYMQSNSVKLASPDSYLPPFVTNAIKNALISFDKKISGFASSDAVLTGAETRTSAPIRILRDKLSRSAIGRDDIYPAGEGAGYAGGITSAAIDGINTALAVMKKYKPVKFGR